MSRKLKKVIVPIGPSIAYVPLSRGMYALVDREDAEWAGQWNWFVRDSLERMCAVRKRSVDEPPGAGKISMHSALLGLTGSEITADHIQVGNLFDNRRCNLRPSTRFQQSTNRRGPANLSGYKGVCFDKVAKRWRVRITSNKRRIQIGNFGNPQEAHIAYAAAAKLYHGEFMRA